MTGETPPPVIRDDSLSDDTELEDGDLESMDSEAADRDSEVVEMPTEGLRRSVGESRQLTWLASGMWNIQPPPSM